MALSKEKKKGRFYTVLGTCQKTFVTGCIFTEAQFLFNGVFTKNSNFGKVFQRCFFDDFTKIQRLCSSRSVNHGKKSKSKIFQNFLRNCVPSSVGVFTEFYITAKSSGTFIGLLFVSQKHLWAIFVCIL